MHHFNPKKTIIEVGSAHMPANVANLSSAPWNFVIEGSMPLQKMEIPNMLAGYKDLTAITSLFLVSSNSTAETSRPYLLQAYTLHLTPR